MLIGHLADVRAACGFPWPEQADGEMAEKRDGHEEPTTASDTARDAWRRYVDQHENVWMNKILRGTSSAAGMNCDG